MRDWLAGLIGADHAARARDDLDELERRVSNERGRRYARRARRRQLVSIVAWSVLVRANDRIRAILSLLRTGLRARNASFDLRYALRQLRRNPLFSLVAVLTLALGIAANTAIFTVVNSVLLRPMPFEDSERLVLLMRGSPSSSMLLVPDGRLIEAWRGVSTALESIEVFSPGSDVMLETEPGTGSAVALPAAAVSAGYLSLVRHTPVIGRDFVAEDELANAPRVALLGWGFWQRAYGGRRDVVGRTLRLEGEEYEIVGVAPAEAELPYGRVRDVDVWYPHRRDASGRYESAGLLAIARLADGMTRERARAELAPVTERLYAESDPDATWTAKVLGPEDLLGDNVRRSLWVLLGAVGLVLLVACANVANLLLTRTLARSRELAVRGALGAGRHRLIRQMFIESATVALIGGIVGFGLAFAGLDLIVALRPDNLRELERLRVDDRVLGFTVAVTALTTLLFGIVPALRASRTALSGLARSGIGALRDSRRGRRIASSLVAAEIALSVVLMIGAGLLIRSMITLLQRDTGFAHEGLATASFELPRDRYPQTDRDAHDQDGVGARSAFFEQLRDAVATLPSIEGTALALTTPPEYGISFGALQIEGRTLVDPPEISFNNFVGPDYFVLLGIEMRDGRSFDAADMEANDVVVVAESFARRYFPDERAVGKRIRFGEEDVWNTIIGVAADLPARGLTDDHSAPQLHFPRNPIFAEEILVVRTTLSAQLLRDALIAVAARVDPAVPAPRVRTMSQRLENSLARERFTLVLLATFAALALLLSAVGLYGIVAHAVGQRTREIGIRRALGAPDTSIVRMVVSQGMRPVAAGAFIGLPTAALLGRLIERLLFGLDPLDPFTFAAVPAILLLTAAFACFSPARRATTVSPTTALRTDS